MPTNPLYDTVIRKLQQLCPSERITRLRNLAGLMTGIFKSKSVHLSKVAMKIPGTAVQLSIVQRLHRFLENPFFHVRTWYEPIARQLLEETGRVVGEIRLVMDATKCGQDHQWLTVSVAFRRRTIPIAWTWLQGSRGHSSATVQLALLKYVHTFYGTAGHKCRCAEEIPSRTCPLVYFLWWALKLVKAYWLEQA